MTSPCRACGACCSYSDAWPRFSTESEAELDRIPARYAGLSGMRCVGMRCSALVGTVGQATACGVYEVRPEVCRDCEPGDEACAVARAAHGLERLEAVGA